MTQLGKPAPLMVISLEHFIYITNERLFMLSRSLPVEGGRGSEECDAHLLQIAFLTLQTTLHYGRPIFP